MFACVLLKECNHEYNQEHKPCSVSWIMSAVARCVCVLLLYGCFIFNLFRSMSSGVWEPISNTSKLGTSLWTNSVWLISTDESTLACALCRDQREAGVERLWYYVLIRWRLECLTNSKLQTSIVGWCTKSSICESMRWRWAPVDVFLVVNSYTFI